MQLAVANHKGGVVLEELSLSNIQLNNLQFQIASQCAPLLCGIKISNLLITESSNFNNLHSLFSNTNISIYNLCCDDNKMYFLLYDHDKLEEYLKKASVIAFMKNQGFAYMEVESVLSVIAQRYQDFIERKSIFPHELGIVLGYPVRDVIGFVKNSGQNYMFIGYWKVYHNPINAKNTFSEYNRVREKMIKLLLEGKEISYKSIAV